GMLVWQDMVCGGDLYHSWFVTVMPNLFPFTGRMIKDRNRWLFSRTQEAGCREYLREVKHTIRQLYHHPCIVLWTAFNEGWGQFDAGKVTDLIRRADPSRLVEETSGWFDQGGGDLNSIHNYFRKLRVSPDPHRCVALTEFGGYSWHIPDRSFNEKEYGYRKYHSKEELTHGIETLWARDLFENIPKGLSASVYTQLSDIEDETNGLMTYDREEIKVDEERIRQANKKLGRVFASACRKRSDTR
ncbi:MAG: glycoside hydrolase family 2, partial [Lachnospiraceae bacterium]|nr:glycoside hydrolase family 2 [Lachnospiraceae bacterium]